MRRDRKGNRAPHENVETNDPLVSALVPLEKQVVRQQHPHRIILLSHMKRARAFLLAVSN